MGAVGGFAADTASPAEAPSAPSSPKPSKPSSLDTYRADAIRFNEQFLRDHYDLRYNTMKKTTEFRPKSAAPSASVITPLPSWGGAGGEASPLPTWGGAGGEASWHPITDCDLNALTVAQLLAGGQSWSYGMRLCIDSSRIESFDPVNDYLDHLPQWDGCDHIAALAARAQTSTR